MRATARRSQQWTWVGALVATPLLLSWLLMPPLDYLPAGNRNLVFGGLLIPPGYSVEFTDPPESADAVGFLRAITRDIAAGAGLGATLAIVTGPIALVCAVAARRVESRSRFVLWSPSRRGWFGLLALCTAVVGVLRLLTYVFGALATLTGASDDELSVTHLAQVLVSVSIAVPLFLWCFREWRRSNLVISALGRDDQDAGATVSSAAAL